MDKKYLPIALIVIIVAVVALALTTKKNTPPTPQTNITPTQTAEQTQTTTYEGKIPCADCEGIMEQLTITKESSNAGTFVLKDTYLGKDVQPFEQTGNWTTIQGTPSNPEAVVIAINSGNPQETSYYLMQGDTLKMLDKDLNEIQSPFNSTLTQKQ